MDPVTITIKLLVSVLCGGVVGWQREARDRPAGLRTHILVCVGAAVYTLASLSFVGPNVDPGRVASQVATGMGFLGAGTIIRHGNMVRGLTTAASLWSVAAIGLCVAIGGGAFWVAGIATPIVLLTLTVLRSVERSVVPRTRLALLTIKIADGAQRTEALRQALSAHGGAIESVEMSEIGPDRVQELQLRVSLPGGCDVSVLGQDLTKLDGFVSMRCE